MSSEILTDEFLKDFSIPHRERLKALHKTFGGEIILSQPGYLQRLWLSDDVERELTIRAIEDYIVKCQENRARNRRYTINKE